VFFVVEILGVWLVYFIFAREGRLGGEAQVLWRIILVEIASGYHL
jgi:hypothetical protein